MQGRGNHRLGGSRQRSQCFTNFFKVKWLYGSYGDEKCEFQDLIYKCETKKTLQQIFFLVYRQASPQTKHAISLNHIASAIFVPELCNMASSLILHIVAVTKHLEVRLRLRGAIAPLSNVKLRLGIDPSSPALDPPPIWEIPSGFKNLQTVIQRGRFWRFGMVDLVVLACVLRGDT